MKLVTLLILTFIIIAAVNPTRIDAQFKSFHSNAYIGYGAIKGNTPQQESLFFSLSVGTGHEIMGDAEFRLGYLYARRITYFLPEDRTNKYYAYIHSFSLKGFIRQTLTANYFLEEGIGIVVINDKTFSDVNVWDWGMGASAMLGVDLTDFNDTGFKFGLGFEFALTFTNTNASYYLFNLQTLYYL